MGNAAGVRRDFAGLERRRMAAAELLKQGMSQSEVARRLGGPSAIGDSLGAAARPVRSGGSEAGRPGWTKAQTEREPTAEDRADAQARTRGARLRQRAVDRGPGAQADRGPVRGALSRGSRLAHPAPARLELPAAHRASTGARRRGGPGLEGSA